MTKYAIIFLILASVAQAGTDCGDPPDLDSRQKGVTIYQHAKVVFQSGQTDDEKMTRYDHLIIWNKNLKELCFSITTISYQLHECYLEGKAIKIRKNIYTHTRNKCQAQLTFDKDKVKINVKGSRGDYCVGEDLGENEGGCGMNTSIDSAIYTKIRVKP